MNKKIVSIGILSIFLLTSLTAVSAFKLEETDAKCNQPLMAYLTDYDPEVDLNDMVNFEISVSDSNGEPASFCNYEVYTRPSEEDISCQRVGDKTIGEFTATRTGMYSLIVDITSVDNNVEKDVFYYFVGSFGTGNIRYYFRDNLPTHGQPTGNGHDCGSLLFTPPTEEENRWCKWWVQFSPDEVPENPISILTNVDIYCWYKFSNPNHIVSDYIGIQKFADLSGAAYIGIQKFAHLDAGVNKLRYVPHAGEYTWINRNFFMIWPMFSPSSWYWLSLKLNADNTNYSGGPYLMTKPDQPSYADFTYIYCTNPDIKSISNTDVVVLAATSEAGNSNNAEIILEGTGTTNLVIQMLDKSKRYSAKLNGVECDFTQVNGELTFLLHLDSKHAEHSLYISPSQSKSSYSTQQSTNPLFFQMLGSLQQNIR